jgi:hypothetical protein
MGPGCGHARQSLPIDLLHELPVAEQRSGGPPGALQTAIHIDIVTVDGSTRPALLTRAPARVTWSVRFAGNHPILRTAVALVPEDGGTVASGASARIGIVGGRSYTELVRLMPGANGASGWKPIEIDLSNYAGWRWSLFFQPYRMTWKIIFGADPAPHGWIAWAQPIIDMGQ